MGTARRPPSSLGGQKPLTITERERESLPRLSNKLRSRRLKMAGHCIRHPELLASDLVLWEPMHGRAQQGRPRQSYLSMLLKEVGTNSKEELRTLMRDRDIWRGLSGVDRT